MDDLEEAIALDRAALALQPDGHPYHSISLSNLEISLWTRFGLCGRMVDLEEAVTLECAALELRPEGHPLRSSSLGNLDISLWNCFERCGRMEDLEEAIALERASLELRPEGHIHRSISLCNLAIFLKAYFERLGRTAVSLLQRVLTIGPTLSSQHQFLSSDTRFQALALDAASTAIDKGDFFQAVEISRARESFALVTALAERFEVSSRRLEALIASSGSRMSGSETDECGSLAYGTSQGRNPADQMFAEMRRLSEEQEAIINEIRRIPSFVPHPLMFYSKQLQKGLSLCSISPSIDPMRSSFCRARMSHVRRESGIGSGEYDEILRRVMKTGRASGGVLLRYSLPFLSMPLAHIRIPMGTRSIFWMTISHPILRPSRRLSMRGLAPAARTEGCSGDTKLPSANRERHSISRIRRIDKLHLDERASPDTAIKALRKVEWVHFVCHGILAEDPFESSLKLPGGNLTLLDIARAHLPNAEFAFLSACHTAEQGPTSALDESLSLAAAMQFIGFRSVVGTMRQLLDRDGPFLAKFVYGHLMYGLEEGEMRFKGAVAAVREAALSQREWKDEGRNGEELDVMTERWVNLVHIGA
ncbi:hypothetical protein A7U60_g6343 [Sanghuangporus baumii]|uniref:CHAT domain-containing protein n=1 Tax=Sanghuangporus baumii TaxID=108892 RepID=A0A9Q5HVJ2_SANBA|nr:hypothetical protein A7U60_g6343 [Sanghuangporus baumii]